MLYQRGFKVNRKFKYMMLIVPISVFLDQITKHWAKSLRLEPPIKVIDNFFNLIYVENKGAAWGIGSKIPDDYRVLVFAAISVLALGMIGYFFSKIKEDETMLIISLNFIFGGAIGNFIDRMAYSSVIDFIDWHYYDAHWPTFNIADVFISIGVGILLLEMIFGKSELSLFAAQEDNKSEE